MMERVALRAPMSPPETGASRQWMPRSAARAAIWRARAGPLVVKSMRSAGVFVAAMVPCEPRCTDSTSAG